MKKEIVKMNTNHELLRKRKETYIINNKVRKKIIYIKGGKN